jgi:hypothetical protein
MMSASAAVQTPQAAANELDAIQVCGGYVEAEYSLQIHDDSGVNQYAQKIFSAVTAGASPQQE